MANFLKSLFFGESEETEEKKAERNFDVLKYDGIKALKIGKTEYAVRCFLEALKIHNDVEILEHLITAYTKIDKIDEAVKTAGCLLEIESDNVAVLLLRGNLNFLLERYEDVIADCIKVTELDSSEPRAFFMAARAKKMKEDRIGAIVSVSQAIALKDTYAEAWLLRAELMLETGDYADGLQDIAKALELMPEEENAWLVKGKLCESEGNGEEAERAYREILELNPFNEQAYMQLGELYVARNLLDEAISLYDEAIELKSDFAGAYNARGKAYMLKGNKEKALEDMKKALELGSETSGINGCYSNFEDMYKNRPL